ncbi:MAG: right-handed parallel beta-helix repeat-containing protein, partial [Clostridia bacterium]|nr:right-handed parallel beta-helix repeat-containing protein [Clostridia bacterium]
VAGDAIHIDGYDNLAYANEITRTGKGGIYLNGGDRETLTPGNNKADNNYIHHWSEIAQTYQPACSLGGVGNICSHNEMHDSPHEAITYSGNNHVIEYNNIHDVCLLTDDAGAIYAGRRWDFYGTVIRYNAVYNLGSDGHRPCGIYMDDALSGQTIYGNLLVNIPSIALHLGGGRDLAVYNNIVVNCNDRSISYDDRAREGVVNNGWFAHSRNKDMEGGMWQLLYQSPWQTDIWKKAYPQMQKFSDDFGNTETPDFVPNPAYSNVNKNIIVNIPGTVGNIADSANRFSLVADNTVYKLKNRDNIFEDAANGNYTLKNTPDGFEQLPFAQIGRY